MKDNLKEFFLHPANITHKKYEALRAVFVDNIPAKDAAQLFGYSVYTINVMKRDFANAMKDNQIDSGDFFLVKTAGRKCDIKKNTARKRIIELRKQNYSILDIKSILHAESHMVSHDYIYRVLIAEGFSRLPKRTQAERKNFSSKLIKAPKSQTIDWKMDQDILYHSERGIGILPFLPLLAWLGIDTWIRKACYPETRELDCVQTVLAFIALKLSGHTRYSQDDIWALDRGFGLFSGLNVLPKDSTLSTYSYRVSRNMNRAFLKAMFQRMHELKLISGTNNMDFTTIPHWGDASVLENNWSGKRRHALKSILSLLCQDSETGIFCYSDAEVKHRNQSDCVLEFVDFWKENGLTPAMLIFDSKFTTYQNLEKLDNDDIQFITLRRRGQNLLSEIKSISDEQWREMRVEGSGRKHEKLKVFESDLLLPGTNCMVRQIVIKDNGHEKETFLITNDRKREASDIIRQYGKRWNVEKGISEQIEFFHLNSLSSSIVVKVDFDLTMSIAAHNFYRIIAQKLIGFEKETSNSLNVKFFSNGGQFQITDESIIIELKKKRHLPLLLEYMQEFQDVQIPWLDNKKIIFKLWATS